MKWSNCAEIKLVLVGIVAAIVFGGGSAKGDFTIGEPVNLGPVINDAYDVQECDFSHDGLELYFSAANRPGGYGRYDLWVARRETINDPWQEPVNLGPNVNSSGGEIEPSISSDGLELYFAFVDDPYTRVCRRASKDVPWGSPLLLLELGEAWRPDISADGLTLYVESDRAGGYGGADIWVATRATKADTWGELVNLGPNVNSSVSEYCPSISTDGLTIVFMRGYTSMWVATRKSVADDWAPPVEIINRTNFNGPAISPDGSTIYFDANTRYWGGYGSGDILQVKFIPIVDFNGDGIVDSLDMCVMVDHWGENYSLCDIVPMPWGDGIVDVQDLIVLAEHLFEEPGLIAHWKLDETEGDTAYNSISVCDGTLIGNPVWQPNGGIVSGALQLDGIDDYVITDPVLNPADGKFSVISWIQGGTPGQVIISQEGGADWLITDTEGNLMTELKGSGRSIKPLQSQTNITDGIWHRIGFVWDGASRTLYVDGIAVAQDTQDDMEGLNSGLYIGTGNFMQPGTFWSGLIDDVRIYNRVVIP